jgi:toxin FitB
MLQEEDIAVSELARLEVLGFRNLTKEAEEYFNAVFALVTVLPISDEVINKAIELRQQSNMKSPDSIVAATAILFCTQLITRNVDDFDHIPNLIIFNPID